AGLNNVELHAADGTAIGALDGSEEWICGTHASILSPVRLQRLRVQNRDVTQIPVKLLEVQSAAHHEAIRNFEAAKIDRHLHNPPNGAVEQRVDAERPRSAPRQRL